MAEWRGLGKKETQSKSSPVTIIRDGKAVMRTRAVVPAVVDDSMWVNPFGPAPEPSSDLWEEPTAPVASKSGFATGTGSLLAASMADLDEAAEAKAFAAAVAEWRNGGTSASNNRRDLDVKTHGAAAGTETSTGMAVTTGTGKKVAGKCTS